MNDAQNDEAAESAYEQTAEKPDTVAEIMQLHAEFGVSIPEAKKDKMILELELILDAHGDRRGANYLDEMQEYLRKMNAMSEFLRKMADATPLQVWQRMIVLAHLAGKTEFKTNAEVARKLKVSPGRVSQIIREIPSDFHSLSKLIGQTAKGSHR